MGSEMCIRDRFGGVREAFQRERALVKGRPDPTRQRPTQPRVQFSFGCSDCGAQFSNAFDLISHVCPTQRRQERPRRERSRSEGPQPGDYGTFTRECSACGKVFTQYGYYDKCGDCIMSGTRRKPSCGYCGKRGHNRGSCPENPAAQRPKVRRCGYCGKPGHTRPHCPNNWRNRTTIHDHSERNDGYDSDRARVYTDGCGTSTKSKWGPKVCDCGSKVTGRLDKSTGIRRVFCRDTGEEIFISEPRFFD